MLYSRNKDMDMEAQRLRAAGWEPVRYGKHILWKSPCGKQSVAIPKTPKGGRGILNKRAEITRVLRELEVCNAGV